MTDEEKLNIPTKFSYECRPSTHSKHYFYIIEIEKDGFGITERAITRALTAYEINELSNSIQRANPNIINR